MREAKWVDFCPAWPASSQRNHKVSTSSASPIVDKKIGALERIPIVCIEHVQRKKSFSRVKSIIQKPHTGRTLYEMHS